MGQEIKNLGNGQLASSKGTIYTVPASTTAIVKNISLVNTNTSAEGVNLYYKKSGGTSRRIFAVDYSLAAGACVNHEITITMGAADVLEGDADTASKVDYVISGMEFT